MKLFPFYYHKLSDYKELIDPVEWLDFLLEGLDPTLSVSKIMGKVRNIIDETEDTKTFVFEIKRPFTYRSGQHLPLTVEINGRKTTRYYSITSIPTEKELSITVKKQPNGLVSKFLHDTVKVGSVIELGLPSGKFVVPEILPCKILMIAGGSGITPVYSILKELAHKGYDGDLKLLYFSKTTNGIIFGSRLKELEKQNLNWDIRFLTTSVATKEPINKNFMEKLVPDYLDRFVFLCGPSSLQETVKQLILPQALVTENFRPYFISPSNNEAGQQVEVILTKSNKTVVLNGTKSLLEELEDNGIYPQHGCRMGICHTCKCTKKTGLVKNIQENKLSDSSEETIQLCISTAQSNLELDI
jgi:stearoyl-CoA 9-desaturase NADPH oxidoreductase